MPWKRAEIIYSDFCSNLVLTSLQKNLIDNVIRQECLKICQILLRMQKIILIKTYNSSIFARNVAIQTKYLQYISQIPLKLKGIENTRNRPNRIFLGCLVYQLEKRTIFS